MRTCQALFLSFLAVMMLPRAFAQPKRGAYTLTAILSGFPDSTKFYLVNLDSARNIDSAVLLHGWLAFHGSVAEPTAFRLYPASADVYCNLWIENKPFTVSGDKSSFRHPTIINSRLSDISTAVDDKHAQLDERRDSLVKRAVATDDNTEAIAIWKQIAGIDAEVQRIRLQTIATEPPSLVTVKELYFLRNDLTQDSLRLLFSRFPADLQRTKYGDVISRYLSNGDVKAGSHYIDISGHDLSGKEVHLSDYEGKVILLDFWAAWCGPCRADNHDLAALSEKYKEKGLEIISFSIDTNPADWKQASEADSISWTNISDGKGLYSMQAAAYRVRAIPNSFLIDRSGIIAEVFPGYDSETGRQRLDSRIAGLLATQ